MANITIGPRLGAMTKTSVKVWCLLDSPGSFTVEYGPYGGALDSSQVSSLITDDAGYVIHVAEVTDLDPHTRYEYRVVADNTLGDYDFVTFPENNSQKFGLFFGSDTHFYSAELDGIYDTVPHKLNNFRSMLDKRNENTSIPYILIFYGDLISSLYSREETQASIRDKMYKFFNYSATTHWFNELSKYVPICFIWDDWDFLGNNLPGYNDYPTLFTWNDIDRTTSKRLWQEWMPLPDMSAEENNLGLSQEIRIGSTLILVADQRYNADVNAGTVPTGFTDILIDGSNIRGPNNRAWGPDVIQWIKDTINTNLDAEFLILVSSGTITDIDRAVAPLGIAKRDSVGVFARGERNEIFYHIDNNTKFRDLIVISGDDHQGIFKKYSELTHILEDDVLAEVNYYDKTKRKSLTDLTIFEYKGTVGAYVGSNFRLHFHWREDMTWYDDVFDPLDPGMNHLYFYFYSGNKGNRNNLTMVPYRRNVKALNAADGKTDYSVDIPNNTSKMFYSPDGVIEAVSTEYVDLNTLFYEGYETYPHNTTPTLYLYITRVDFVKVIDPILAEFGPAAIDTKYLRLKADTNWEGGFGGGYWAPLNSGIHYQYTVSQHSVVKISFKYCKPDDDGYFRYRFYTDGSFDEFTDDTNRPELISYSEERILTAGDHVISFFSMPELAENSSLYCYVDEVKVEHLRLYTEYV